jgi:hypothetical protein
MADPLTETFDAPPDAVFAAAWRAAEGMAKTIDGVDQSARTLYFNTGMSAWSWNGQNVTVAVIDDGAGGSQLHVGTGIKRTGMSSIQVISWGEGKRVARKLIANVRKQLGAPAPGVSSGP